MENYEAETAGNHLPLHWTDLELLGSRPSFTLDQLALEEDAENAVAEKRILTKGDHIWSLHMISAAHPDANYYIRFMPRAVSDGDELIGEFQVTGEWTNGVKISLEEQQLNDPEFMSGSMKVMEIASKGLPKRWIGCSVERKTVV
jgi:hypothetical protein